MLAHCLKSLCLIVMNNFQCVSAAQKQIRNVFQEQIKINHLWERSQQPLNSKLFCSPLISFFSLILHMASLLFLYVSSAIFTAKSNLQLKKCSLTSLQLLFFALTFSYLFSDLCLDEKAKAPGRYLSVLLKMLCTSAKCLESCACFYQRSVFPLWSYQAHQFSAVSRPATAFGISFPGKKKKKSW